MRAIGRQRLRRGPRGTAVRHMPQLNPLAHAGKQDRMVTDDIAAAYGMHSHFGFLFGRPGAGPAVAHRLS